MSPRKNSAMRRQVDAVIADLRAYRINITAAAQRLIADGAPFDVMVRVIARNSWTVR